MKNQVSSTINTNEDLVIDISLVLSVRVSQEGQKHLFSEDNVSLSRSLSKDDFILLVIGRSKMLHFSFAAEQRQVLQVETRSFAKTDVPLRSSKTTRNTSSLDGTLPISDMLCLRAHRKSDGSLGFKAFCGWTYLKW